MRTCGRTGGIIIVFLDISHLTFLRLLTPALDGDEWSDSGPNAFTPGTHWIGGWVTPGAVWTL
jgi:hypothetical protein